MLYFLVVEYAVYLIIHYYTHLFVFPCSYVGSFVLKGCVADEKVADSSEIDEMLSTIISNATSKTSNAISLAFCLIFFPNLAFQSPVKNASDLFLSSLRTVLTLL